MKNRNTKVGDNWKTPKALYDELNGEFHFDFDPCAGSGVTLLGAKNLNRKAYGFEIKKDFFKEANEKVLTYSSPYLFCQSEKVRYTERQQELIEV